MKKVLLLFLVLSTMLFSEGNNNSRRINPRQEQELRNKIEVAKQEIKLARDRGEFYQKGTIAADTIQAEIFLEVIDGGKGDLSKLNLELILPDVDAVDRNVIRISKRLHRVRVLLLTQKSKYPAFKNRTLEELKEKPVYSKLAKINNIVIDEIVIDDETLDEMVENGKNMRNLIDYVYRNLGIDFGGEKNEKL